MNVSRFDERRLHWLQLVVAVILVLAILNAGDGPPSDSRVQVVTVLGLALASTMFCIYWALRLRKAGVTTVNYVSGTTASRTMAAFWAMLFILYWCAPLFGVEGQAFTLLWQSSLSTFAGIGSVILTAGPAYKEYKEAMSTVSSKPFVGSRNRPLDDTPTVTRSDNGYRHGSRASLLLFSVLAVVVIFGKSGRVNN